MNEATTNLTSPEAPLETTAAVNPPTVDTPQTTAPVQPIPVTIVPPGPTTPPLENTGDLIPTEHDNPSPEPAGTPLMTLGLLPTNAEAPSEEAMANDPSHQLAAAAAQADPAAPLLDDQGRTAVGVTTLVEANALSVLNVDEHAEPFEGDERFIRAFQSGDGKMMRVVHHDDALAAQEMKQD